MEDGLGRAVPGVEILVDAADVPPGRADESGRAVFAHLRPGEYAVDAATPDGMRAGGRARVAPAGTTTLRLVVAPGADEGGTSAVAEPSTIGPGRLFGPGELRGRPRPSDPWSFLRDVPGIVLDRVDVGGSETAQQSLVVSRGDPGSGVTWTLDGADVTDPAALGSTTLYADTDALGAIAVRTSALDARVRTAGVQVGLFTPSVGRAWSGAVHAAATGPQSDNLPDALRDRPFARPRTGRVFDLGAQAGGPVRRGRAWAWGAAGLDRLRQATAGGHDETLRLAWLSGRGVVRAGSGRLSLLATRSEKVHDDRDTTATAEEAARWRQSGPTHLVTLEDVRPWGRLSVLTRASFLDSGFSLRPRGGDANAYEDFRGIFRGSYQTFETHRPRIQAGTEVATSGRRVGFDHRVAAGVGYRRSTITTEARWPGNQVLGLERQTVFFRTFRLTGFALPTRAQSARSVQEHAEVWIQDEARRGRLAATLGLRLDRLWGRNLASRVGANPVFPDLLPAVAYGGGPTSIRWTDVLPRAGLGFDLRRDGSMVARVGYGAYGAALGSGEVTFDNPVGREGASVTYYWRDANGDHAVQRNEIDRARGRLGTGGIVPDAPGIARSPHAVAPELRSPRTHETFVAFEHRGSGRLGGHVRVSWRRLVDPLWRPLAGLTLGDYVARGRVQGELQGESYDVVYFAPASTSRIVPGNGRVLSNRSGYFQDAWTFETSLRGRLGGLEWNAWGTLLDWREFFSDVPQSVQDPTPTESEPLRDGGTLAVRAGGLGRDAFVSARWTAGAAAAAPLVAGVRAALRLHARDGFPIPYFQVANTGDPTAGSKNVLVSPQVDRYRLPAVVVLDVRLSREFAVPGGHLTTSVDAFNALDSAATLQVVRDVELPAFDRPRELVRPRIVRFGLEYRFGGARRLQ